MNSSQRKSSPNRWLWDLAVKEGDILNWQDLLFTVIDTPGYTRGAVSYLVNIDGRKIGFTGDLISGDGQLFDLYSLQDAISGTRIRGYHGYAGRITALLESLRKVRDQQCDLLVPARGPVIKYPAESINRLISRAAEGVRQLPGNQCRALVLQG